MLAPRCGHDAKKNGTDGNGRDRRGPERSRPEGRGADWLGSLSVHSGVEWIGMACIGEEGSGLVLCSDTTERTGRALMGRAWKGLDRTGLVL